MPEGILRILLDQNVPRSSLDWLRQMRPSWHGDHVALTDLSGKSDHEIFIRAQTERAIVVTYDEDFADARTFPLGAHHGIIRLRVWPTTPEITIAALKRILDQVPESDLPRNLLIVDNQRIRLRKAPI